MIYFIIPLFLIVYFELVGQLVLNKFNYPVFRYNSPIGFIVFSALMYLILPIFIYFHLPTIILFVVGTLMFAVFTILIIINHKIFRFNFNYTIVPVALFFAMAFYKYYNSGLGGRGFDTSYYLTWISSIIEYPNLNQFSIKYGPAHINQSVGIGDMFLTYYHLAAYFVWAGRQIFSNLLNYTYDYMPAYVWTMAILYFNFFITTVFNLIEKLKINNKLVITLIYIFIGFYIGNLYWHNTYAFYGNTYRFYVVAYVVYFIYELNNDNKDSTFPLLFVSSLALCSTGTSSTYFMVLIGYAYLFTQYKTDNKVIRNSAILLFIPFTHLVFYSDNGELRLPTIFVITMMIIAIIFNERLYKIFRKFNLFRILVILIPIGLIVVSQYLYGFTENYDKFFNHISGVGDMTWEFFRFRNWQYVVVNFFVYTLFINFIIRNRKTPLAKFLLIILLTFLNPLSGALIAGRVKPYLRAFDIILNPFTYIIFINSLYETLSRNKYIQNIIFTALITVFSVIGYNYFTSYYNPSMAPTENFNHIYKIDNNELEPIILIDGIIRDNDLQNVQVISHSLYFRAFQPQSYNIYNRFYQYIENGNDKELYEIFYPKRDYSERKDNDLYDYDNAYNLLIENRYDFVICDKQYDLYNVEREWYYPRYQILDYYVDSIYENDEYMVFWTYLEK